MSYFIEELTREHAVIAETLKKIKSLGISSKEGQKTLISAKSTLLAHLKKEDEQLYPVLKKAAKNDFNLDQTLDLFAKDMEGISKTALEFFEQYSGGGSGLEFAKNFGRLSAALTQRIFKEENILYKKYAELKQ